MIPTKEESLGEKWENKDVCRICGGKCCKRTACEASPFDFDNDNTKMAQALATGNYSIDLVMDKGKKVFKKLDFLWTIDVDFISTSNEACLFMRPRNQGKLIVDMIHYEENPGPCIFWNKDSGCKLPYEERPKYGRSIIPIAPGICEGIYDTHRMLIAEWHPYFDFLYQMARKYFDSAWHIQHNTGFIIK